MRKQNITRQSQRGAVLIIGLIMLLLLTVIGLASIRGSDLQERMAGNMRDRNLAFQAAEAGLRYGENKLNAPLLPSFTGSVIGYWPDLNKPSPLRPRIAAWVASDWEANSVELPDNTISDVATQPRFTIEKVIVTGLAASYGSAVDHESMERMADAEYFRVTARGIGGTTDAEVILQSTFIR
jgi:type IV pilus assembly protein PilX